MKRFNLLSSFLDFLLNYFSWPLQLQIANYNIIIYFRPEKKYKLIERRIQKPGPVVYIANKYLHSYNMKNNPGYRKTYVEEKMDRKKESKFDYFDYKDDHSFNYHNKENSFDNVENDDDDAELSETIKRPAPTSYKDLTSRRKRYNNYQNSKQSYSKPLQDYTYRGNVKSQTQTDYQNYMNPQTDNNYHYPNNKEKISTLSDYNKYHNIELQTQNPIKRKDYHSSYVTSPPASSSHDQSAYSSEPEFGSVFNTFNVDHADLEDFEQKFDDDKQKQAQEQEIDSGVKYQNGVQKGFHQYDSYDSTKHSDEDEMHQNVHLQHQNQQKYEPNPPKVQYQSSNNNGFRPMQSNNEQSQHLTSYKRPTRNSPPYKTGKNKIPVGKLKLMGRNFFPKTNEKQPLVDVSGFGPSFTTTFFDELDLHSGFFDHNFPGSPEAGDYKLNFIKNNPQFPNKA